MAERIKLSTEIDVYFVSSIRDEETVYDLSPKLNSNIHTLKQELKIKYPIYMNLDLLF